MAEDTQPIETSSTEERQRSYRPPVLINAQETSFLVPKTTDDLKSLVDVIIRSGCVPDAYKDGSKVDPAKIAVGILTGLELGLAPMQALQSIYIIRGMPTVWGKGAKALVLKSGQVTDYKLRWINILTGEDMAIPGYNVHTKDWPKELACEVSVGRRGVATAFIGTFSVGDAARAGLWNNTKKTTWIDYPKDMLEHKAAARVWDRGFSDCLKGVAIRELIEEKDDPAIKAPSDVSFIGAENITSPPTEIDAEAEFNLLRGGLERITSTDLLRNWFDAAEERIKYLTSIDAERGTALMKLYVAAEHTLSEKEKTSNG